MKTGVEIIAEERERQIKELLAIRYDATVNSGGLARAAACYAMPDELRRIHAIDGFPRPALFPFVSEYWKPTPSDRIHELAKAALLSPPRSTG